VLRAVAEKHARADGWVLLSLAGQKLAADHPELMNRLRQAFGYRGLKDAVAAMGNFDLREEPTGSGVIVFYRA